MLKRIIGKMDSTFNHQEQDLDDFIFSPERTHEYIENEDTEELPWLWSPVPKGEEESFLKKYLPYSDYKPEFYPGFIIFKKKNSQHENTTLNSNSSSEKETPFYVVMDKIACAEESKSYENGIKALREVEEARNNAKQWAMENIPEYEEYNYYTPLGEDRTLFKVGESYVEEFYDGAVIVEKTNSYTSLDTTEQSLDSSNIIEQIQDLVNSPHIPLNLKIQIIDDLYESYLG